MNSQAERWRAIPGFPQFEASSLGRIRLVPFTGRNGRVYGGSPQTGCDRGNAKLTVCHRRKQYAVHRLVCLAFNGPPPPGATVCMHLDENYRNNRPENLAWGTQRENLNAPGLRAWWTPERQATARQKAWATRRAAAHQGVQ